MPPASKSCLDEAREKIRIARQLERMLVDVMRQIPAAAPGDFEASRRSPASQGQTVFGLARGQKRRPGAGSGHVARSKRVPLSSPGSPSHGDDEETFAVIEMRAVR